MQPHRQEAEWIGQEGVEATEKKVNVLDTQEPRGEREAAESYGEHDRLALAGSREQRRRVLV